MRGGRITLLLTAMVVAFAVSANPAWASTFTVNSTGDGADLSLNGTCDANPTVFVTCTLRAAIQEANAAANPGPDSILFEIPSNGGDCAASTLCTISPASALPAITEGVTIDGYTQGDASANTLTGPGATNAVLRVELRGATAPANTNGLTVHRGPTTIRGLVINEFGGTGIAMLNVAGNTNNVVEGNFLGTDPSGLVDEGNGLDGVQCFGQCSDSRIGGPLPAGRNLSSGNGEGKTFLGQRKVKTNPKGKRAFAFTAVLPPGEQVVSATATHDATDETSEFSDAIDAF